METYTLELTDEELRDLIILKRFFNFYKNKHESVNYELFKRRMYSGRYSIRRALETPARTYTRSTKSPEYQKWEAVALENDISNQMFYQRVRSHPNVSFELLAEIPAGKGIKKWLVENGRDSHKGKEDDTTIRTIKYYLEQGIPLNRKHRAYYEAHKEEFQ